MKRLSCCALLVDTEAVPHENPQLEIPHEDVVTEVEFHIAEHFRLQGIHAEIVPVTHDLRELITQLEALKPDLVFNLTEHFNGERSKDLHIASLLELLHLPYTGCSPVGLAVNRDKAMCKRILGYHRIAVPDFFTVHPGQRRMPAKLNFPRIVKPALEDGSDGISLASVVYNRKDMLQRIQQLHERMRSPVICEAFIEGRELYVSVLGNQRLTVLPPRELCFPSDRGGPMIATQKVKQDEAYRDKWGIEYGPADVSPELMRRLSRVCKKVFHLLQLRDYGRIDLRLTPQGNIYVLEANPNPDLTDGDEVAESAKQAGISYEDLIDRIVHQALKRSVDTEWAP